jgi:hypothetical protein
MAMASLTNNTDSGYLRVGETGESSSNKGYVSCVTLLAPLAGGKRTWKLISTVSATPHLADLERE